MTVKRSDLGQHFAAGDTRSSSMEATLGGARQVVIDLTDGRQIAGTIVEPPDDDGRFVVQPWGTVALVPFNVADVKRARVPIGFTYEAMRAFSVAQAATYGGGGRAR